MKRRLIALMTAVCLVAAPMNVMAEDILKDIPEIENFSLHSGVMFGDSVEDVKAKEKEAGFSVSDENETADTHTKRVFFSGMFAGISDSGLRYTFHGDEGVYSAHYGFGDEQGYQYDSQSEDFDVITDELIKKYGDPIYNEGEGTPFILLNYKENDLVIGWSEYNFKRQVYSSDELGLYRYNQWLIKTDDYYVLIDHCIQGEWFKSSSKWYYGHDLTYLCLDEQTVVETLEEYDSSQNAKADSINNDL